LKHHKIGQVAYNLKRLITVTL